MLRNCILLLFLWSAGWAQTAIEGTVFDCTGALVAGARVMLTENYVLKTETVSGRDGRWAFSGVQPGLYQVLVKKERFELFGAGVMARDERASRLNVVLKPDRMREGSGVAAEARAPVAAEYAATPYQPPAGGGVQFHKMVRPPRPGYPEAAAAAGVQGPVTFFTRVKADGSVEVAAVLASPDAALEAAARQAIGQMRVEPMKVNGKPVEFDMEFTIDFRLKK